LRNCAATLITLSGIGHIAALWLRELTPSALVDALLGSVYLIIGIGLFGQSRFTLFMAILVPAAAAWLILDAGLQQDPVYRARLATDGLVALLSALALWQVRRVPTP
jgi:hypothetical protein